MHLYQDKESIHISKKYFANLNSSLNNQDKSSDLHSERSNGQIQPLAVIQSFSFIGNKDKSGIKNGFGIQKWKDGSIYKGNFINNMAGGFGIFYHSDGDIHKGTFEDGIT